MTAQTTSYLKNTLFGTNQASSSITALRMEDIPDSFVPWDDPANASGLSAPAIVRGTVSTYGMIQSGQIVAGAGQTTLVRQANATALQAFATYVGSSGKFGESPAAVIEINSSTGIVCPANGGAGHPGFTWKGERGGTQIVQYYSGGTGAPILTIGDPAGVIANNSVDISGFDLSYGTAQTGQTSSIPLLICGPLGSGRIGHINICPGFTFPGYDGWQINNNGCYSVTFYDILVQGAQRHCLYYAYGSTGNLFDNIYLGMNGFGFSYASATLSGSFVFTTGFQDTTFRRLNCEWGACNSVFNLGSASPVTGLLLEALHLEGIQMIGSNPTIFSCAGTSMQVCAMNLVDTVVQAANFTGTPSLISDWTGASVASTVRIDTFTQLQQNTGKVTTPLSLVYYNVLGDADPRVVITNGKFYDSTSGTVGQLAGNILFDKKLPVANFPTPLTFEEYDYLPMASRLMGAVAVVSATYTHYSQHASATILVPANITSFTITLANTKGPTGNQLPDFNNTVRIRRLSGSAAGTLTVKNAAGTTLSTNTTSATDLWYVYGGVTAGTFGAQWTALTPVTS